MLQKEPVSFLISIESESLGERCFTWKLKGAIFMREDKDWKRDIFYMLEHDTLPCLHNELFLECSASTDL